MSLPVGASQFIPKQYFALFYFLFLISLFYHTCSKKYNNLCFLLNIRNKVLYTQFLYDKKKTYSQNITPIQYSIQMLSFQVYKIKPRKRPFAIGGVFGILNPSVIPSIPPNHAQSWDTSDWSIECNAVALVACAVSFRQTKKPGLWLNVHHEKACQCWTIQFFKKKKKKKPE